MKCQHCEKPATFHITELTDPEEPQELHLCEDHARLYLTQDDSEHAHPPSLAGVLAQQLKISQTAEELQRLDQKACPVCGITFYEFRQGGRLGCPHDYVCFESDLELLIVNIHGEARHIGKRPKRGTVDTEKQTELIRLRQEMKEAIDQEEYEHASVLRDKIKQIEDQRHERQG